MAKKLGIKKEDLIDLFAEFDTDGSDSIDCNELQEFAASVGIYWDHEMAEQAVKDMDADNSGDVNITEFATWFVRHPAGEASDELKMKMQAKLVLRTISKALNQVKADAKGMECKNVFGVGMGSPQMTEETCVGMAKFFITGCGPEEMASLNGPEDGKIAFHVDFTLRDDASDDDIATLKEGLQEGFDMFVSPMLDMIPPPPSIPGMNEGKVYETHKVEKVNVDGTDYLRFIVFSGLDPASLYRDTGLTIGDFIPTIHYAAYSASKASDLFSRDSTFKLGDAAARVEYSIVWNTKILHAVAAMAEQPAVQNLMDNNLDIRDPGPKMVGTVIKLFCTMFKKQRSSVEIRLNGLADFLRTGLIEFALPEFEKQVARMEESARDPYARGSQMEQKYLQALRESNLYPTEERAEQLIAAICNLSGKTPANIGAEIINMGPIIPAAMLFGHTIVSAQDILDANPELLRPDSFVSPLYGAKAMLAFMDSDSEMVPPPVKLAKKVGVAFYKLVSGLAAVQVKNEIFKAGFAGKGIDHIMILPTMEQIEAAEMKNLGFEMPSCTESEDYSQWEMSPRVFEMMVRGYAYGLPEDFVPPTEQFVDYYKANANFWIKLIVQEGWAFFNYYRTKIAEVDSDFARGQVEAMSSFIANVENPESGFPPLLRLMVTEADNFPKVTDAEIAEFQDKFSEVLAIAQLFVPAAIKAGEVTMTESEAGEAISAIVVDYGRDRVQAITGMQV